MLHAVAVHHLCIADQGWPGIAAEIGAKWHSGSLQHYARAERTGRVAEIVATYRHTIEQMEPALTTLMKRQIMEVLR